MSKFLSLAIIGLGATALTLATPHESQAQVPIGVQIGVGRVGISAGILPPPVYSYPVYAAPPVVYAAPPPVCTVAPAVVVRAAPVVVVHRHHHRYWHR